MDQLILTVEKRDVDNQSVNLVRQEGKVPGVIYGAGSPTQTIVVDERELTRLYSEAGTSRVFEVHIGDEKKNALFHDVQVDFIKDNILHFDLLSVRMDEVITTEVPLHFTGESPAVFTLGGVLIKPLEAIEVEALPADLPEEIVIDIGTMVELNDEIRVSDLQVGPKVKVLSDPDELVARVEPPQEEEEEEEIPEDAEAAVESDHGGEEEGEEGESKEETAKEDAEES